MNDVGVLIFFGVIFIVAGVWFIRTRKASNREHARNRASVGIGLSAFRREQRGWGLGERQPKKATAGERQRSHSAH